MHLYVMPLCLYFVFCLFMRETSFNVAKIMVKPPVIRSLTKHFHRMKSIWKIDYFPFASLDTVETEHF